MATYKWDQVNFSRGELDPRVQVRTDWPNYYKAAKRIRNCVSIPQGGVTRRWGTNFVTKIVVDSSNFEYIELTAFPYNNNLIYLLLWNGSVLNIFLENKSIASIDLPYNPVDIPNLKFSQAKNRLIICDGNHQPQQLVRTSDTPVLIETIDYTDNIITAPINYTANQVLPVQFGLADNIPLPSTVPQIYSGRDYFIKVINSSGDFKVYSTSIDAVNGTNEYQILNPGTSQFAAYLIVNNTWSVTPISFIHYPSYDFNTTNYTLSSITFTLSFTPPNPAVKITCNQPIFTDNRYIGGVFSGGGNIIRITSSTYNDSIDGTFISKVPDTVPPPITGDLCYLGQPAWSDKLGWPRCSALYQNRLVMAGTYSIPNGQWLSVINDYYDFDDAEDQSAESAISWYPSTGDVSYIESMTSARSLLVHTNTANYSTSIQNESVVTPGSYMLVEHNKYGVGSLAPVFVDNQLFFVDRSGNNIITMAWDFIQGNYVTSSASLSASSLIRSPVDMTSFSEPLYLNGFYVLFVNADGTICVLQTLKEEDILAFSLCDTTDRLVSGQNNLYLNTKARYIKTIASQNRCWLLVARNCLELNNVRCPITSVDAINNAFVCLSNAGAILNGFYYCILKGPTATPPIANQPIITNNFYFIRYIGSNKFKLFGSLNDAINNTNAYTITRAGAGWSILLYNYVERLYVEEINFDCYMDFSSTAISNTPFTQINELDYLNGQVVKVVADGYVLQDRTVVNGSITIERPSLNVKIGLPYTSTLVPLPAVIPEQPGMLFNPRHIKTLYIGYYNTVGATVQGYGIPTQRMGEIILDAPLNLTAGSGVFTYAPMEGWSGAMENELEITQTEPLPMTITGLSYVIDLAK